MIDRGENGWNTTILAPLITKTQDRLSLCNKVVPDRFLTQHTGALVQVRDYCQLALADILEERGIQLQSVNMDFVQWLAEGERLKPDMINYFAYEPDGYLVMNVTGVLKEARAHAVGIFSAVHLDDKWLQREILQSMILRPDSVTVPIQVHDITRLTERKDSVHTKMRSLSEAAMQRKIF